VPVWRRFGNPLKIVIPPKAGIHRSAARAAEKWVPAFAGMTNEGREIQLKRSGERISPSPQPGSVLAGGELRRLGFGGCLLLGGGGGQHAIALGGDLAQMRDNAAGTGRDQPADDHVLLQPGQ
jgi:hypothetical protein